MTSTEIDPRPRRNRKRRIAILSTSFVLLGGAAFAYWTSGGSGTGTGTTGTNVAITVVQTSTVSAMGPGDSAQTLSGNFTNTNSGPAYVGTVTASISSVTKATGAPAGTCTASDYTLANAVMTVNAEVPAGTAKGAWTGATLKFNNSSTVNQDACKGATVNLSYLIG